MNFRRLIKRIGRLISVGLEGGDVFGERSVRFWIARIEMKMTG